MMSRRTCTCNANDARQSSGWNPVVELAQNWGFARHELNELRRIAERHRELMLEAWHEHFG